MPTWTPEQTQAIASRDANLLVSAAAGSGKTAVLVQRIVDLVLRDNIDIDRMLIVTFTNAAAAEMKERIAKELINVTKTNPELTEPIRRQTLLLNRSFIMTMHSFCMQLLKTHFHLIGLDPTFRIGNETEVALLKQEALAETLETFYEEAHPDFHQLVESFCAIKSDKWLETTALRIYHFIQSQPNPQAWLEEQTGAFEMSEEAFQKSPWMNTFMKVMAIKLEGLLHHLQKAYRCCASPGGPDMYSGTIETEIASLQEIIGDIKNNDPVAFTKLQHIEFGRLKPARKVDETLKNLAQSHRNGVKDELKKMQKDWFFSARENWLADIQHMKQPMAQLCRVITAFTDCYTGKKRMRNMVDFNDLEHLALEVLAHPEATAYYKQQFHHIFVDEYQDSNRVQETIIDHIKGENNVFMVGDVKQSIYRFRLAEPELFLNKQQTYSHDENADHRRIDLNRNFRSRDEIINGVNFIFRQIMSPYLGEMDYDTHAELKSGGIYPEDLQEAPIEIHLLEKNTEDDRDDREEREDREDREDPDVFETLSDLEIEVELVANRIKEALKGEVYDERLKAMRPVAYRDIVVLMRATKKYQQMYQDVFTKAGIPIFADAGGGFFDTIEVQVFVNLLKIIDNVQQDIPLLSVLRSPIGHFSVNELAEIKCACPAKSFYESFLAYTQTTDNSLQKKALAFMENIHRWRQRKEMPLFEYVWWLLMETGYYSFISVMPGGEQRQANLRILAKRAHEYETIQTGSVFGYLHYIEKISAGKSGDMGVAKLISPNADVVRVMSIHKSKGLEFPIVMLAGITRKFNLKDTYEKLLVHKDLGFGPICAEPEKRVYRNTLSRAVIKEKLRQESLSEEMRILYVAMTRPKQKLVMIGSLKNAGEKWEKWTDALSAYELSKGQSYLDWIGPALASTYPNTSDPDTLAITSREWVVKAWTKEALATEVVTVKEAEQHLEDQLRNQPHTLTGNHQAYVASQLAWSYPYQKMTETPVKYTVTELLRQQQQQIQQQQQKQQHEAVTGSDQHKQQITLHKTPGFMLEKQSLSPAERGSLLHYIIQHIDVEAYHQHNNLAAQLSGMVVKEMLSPEEHDIIDLIQIEAFLESPLGQRMISSTTLYREWPFVMQQELEQGKILVQGIIDCFFEENNQWTLVDFKTDRLQPRDIETWKEKYRTQLDLYKEALETLTDRKVADVVLYSIYLNKAIRLDG